MTVLVTTSRICLTLVRDDFCFFSAKRALRAASQSKTECTDRGLNGDLAVVALIGESRLPIAGLGGSLRLGKLAAPVGGADMGTEAVKGLGGIMGAVAGEEAILILRPDVEDVGDDWPDFDEHSDCSLASVSGIESGVVSPEAMAGELSDMALVRKSV